MATKWLLQLQASKLFIGRKQGKQSLHPLYFIQEALSSLPLIPHWLQVGHMAILSSQETEKNSIWQRGF